MSDFDDFVARVEHVTGRQGRRVGGETLLLCPAHDDHDPSLSVRAGNNGRPLVQCRSQGCSYDAICEAIDWKRPRSNEPVAVYVYTDEQGKPLREVGRFEKPDGSKTFAQRRPHAPDWKGGVKGVRAVLYRLPEVVAAIADGRDAAIWINEGEKQADLLRSRGRVATTNPMGAGKWKRWCADQLAGAPRVFVIADDDTPGRAHAEDVARSLYGRVGEVKVVKLWPDGETKRDVIDFYRQFATAEEADRALVEIVEQTTPYVPQETLDDERELADDRRPLDDDGNALRLVDRYGDEFRYVIGDGFYVWDGARWRRDNDGAALRAAREIADELRTQARRAREERGEDDAITKALSQHARRSTSQRGIRAMVDLARVDLRLIVHPDQLDPDPYLLNASNGTIDLRTGELRPHAHSDLITRRVACDYDPNAAAPTWAAFLERVQPSEAVRAFLQRRAGQAALGHNNDELLFVDHGDGANGKSKWWNTVAAALGDYAATIDAQLLIDARRRSAGQPELMRLRGARLVIASETSEGDRLNVALVKGLVGGDKIACRLLYENEIVEFTPKFSPWLITNHKPTIAEQSEAIWRRVRLVPFDVTIPRNERDLTLQGKLLAELPGVLAWIVEGARAYIADGGLHEPGEVEQATAAYRDEENPVGRFVSERCEIGLYYEQTSALFAVWKDWCIRNGEDAGTLISFGKRLSQLRDEAGRECFPADRVGQTRVRTGLRLLPRDESDWMQA